MRQQRDQGHLPRCCLLTADVALIIEPMQFPATTPRYGPLGGLICHCHYLSDQQNIHLSLGSFSTLFRCIGSSWSACQSNGPGA